jgi:hypothetical protein
VAEPGLRLGRDGHTVELAAMAAPGMARSAAIEETIEVTPDELPVTAQVEVGFTFATAEPAAT